MTTEQAFKEMVKRYNLFSAFNALVKIDNRLVTFIQNTFCYAVIMADTNRHKKLAINVYNSVSRGEDFKTDEILDAEITSEEIPLIYEKFIENLNAFITAVKK